jgi:hypothetical protein
MILDFRKHIITPIGEISSLKNVGSSASTAGKVYLEPLKTQIHLNTILVDACLLHITN